MNMHIHQSGQQVLAGDIHRLGLRNGQVAHSGHDAVLHQDIGTDKRSAGIHFSPFEQLFHPDMFLKEISKRKSDRNAYPKKRQLD